MPRSCWSFAALALLAIVTSFATSLVSGQAQAQTLPASRITQPIDDNVRVTLKGNVHPLAQPRFDQGAVPDSFPVQRALLILQRSPDRESDLQEFLLEAHRPGSPSYHQWLTSGRFATLFGPQDSEVAAVSTWLQSHGFSIARVTSGKTAIEFSGSAGQLREAFHTEIHTYAINGETHYANNMDPQIPAALAPIVAGITPLNDFRPTSYLETLGRASYNPKTHKVTPQWTTGTGLLALAPGDFAVQYDLNPLYAAGTNGNGVIIGIIGASDVNPTVVANYRSLFGVPAGTLNIVLDGADPTPGEGNWATGESYLDVEVSGSVAPGAVINLYTAADTTVQSGLLLAAQRAVDDDEAPILSTSYGTCEQQLGSSGNQFWADLWEQAAAQGQSSFVSSGDSGSAGCDDFDIPEPAGLGLAVSGFASTPWNIAVGGTDFFYTSYNGGASAQQAQLATYWNLTRTDQPATSLLQPVPEQPWNRSFGLNLTNGGVLDQSSPGIVGGSGGASNCTSGVAASSGGFASCTAGYAKPAWQSGKGVPSDGARDIPDVSLFAAAGENGSSYLVCVAIDDCIEFEGNISVEGVGGTSASTPAMAGILALINQKYGRQGQANFILYPLAAQHPSAFHDVTVGSNNVPCEGGTLDCTVSTLDDNTKGFLTLGHYYATAGYDEASGLGSVDANLLVEFWNALSFTSTSTSLSLSQTSFTHGTPVHVNVGVTGSGGTPSGDVGLVTTATPAINAGVSALTLQAGAASATVDNFPGGQYQLTAKYTGDTIFAPSNSTPVALDVTPEPDTITLSGSYWSNAANSFLPIAAGGSYAYGTYFAIDAQPIGANAPAGSTDGIATGTISFTDVATSATVSSGPVNLNSKGIAEWQSAVELPVGASSVTASYPGDASFRASTSPIPLTLTVSKAQTAGFLDAKPSPIGLGSPTTLTLTIGTLYAGPPCEEGSCTFAFPLVTSPTGTVTFSVGMTTLGTVPLVSGASLGAGNAEINLTVPNLPLGTDVVTASYSGDSNYTPATFSFNVVVEQPVTLTASTNPTTVNQAEFTQIPTSVTGGNGMPVPTGTVNFSGMGPGSGFSDTEALINGSVTSKPIAGGIFVPGAAPVTVTYNGDSTYGPATTTVSFTVVAGDQLPFSLTSTSVSIAPGATTGNASSVTVTPVGGFTGSVYLSCALTSAPASAQNFPTCNIPSSVDIINANAVMASMTVSSTAPESSGGVSPSLHWHLPNGPRWPAVFAAALLFALLSFSLFSLGRNSRRVVGLLFGLALLGTLAACGGGGGVKTPTNPGTTAGNYTFIVNATISPNGASEAQTTVTVTVQ
ncbi:MAG: Ig-like domain repeat protein [Candidatus Acidiferrales bacterium]